MGFINIFPQNQTKEKSQMNPLLGGLFRCFFFWWDFLMPSLIVADYKASISTAFFGGTELVCATVSFFFTYPVATVELETWATLFFSPFTFLEFFGPSFLPFKDRIFLSASPLCPSGVGQGGFFSLGVLLALLLLIS